MEPTGCPQTPATNYHSTLCKIPKDPRPHLHCCRSLRSHICDLFCKGLLLNKSAVCPYCLPGDVYMFINLFMFIPSTDIPPVLSNIGHGGHSFQPYLLKKLTRVHNVNYLVHSKLMNILRICWVLPSWISFHHITVCQH